MLLLESGRRGNGSELRAPVSAPTASVTQLANTGLCENVLQMSLHRLLANT